MSNDTSVPWNIELWSRQIKKKSSSSMGFHGIRRAPFQITQVFHGIPWNIPWNAMEHLCNGTLVPPNEISLSSMEFHGTLRLSFKSIPCYPWLAWDIPWNSMEIWSSQKKSPSSMGFHGIRRAPFQITRALWNSMEFHGTLGRQMKYNLVPLNSMELWYRQMKYNLVPRNSMKYSMEFHGTLVPPNEI